MYILSATLSLGGYVVRMKLRRQMFTIVHWMVKEISIGGWYFLLSTCPPSVWWLLRRKSTSTAWQKPRSRFLRVSLCKCGIMISSHLTTLLVSSVNWDAVQHFLNFFLGFVLLFCFITFFFTLHFLFFFPFLFTCTSFVFTPHFHTFFTFSLLIFGSPTP